MELRDITMDDLPLYEALLTDPRVMAELGGPLPRDGLKAKLRDIVSDVEVGRTWYLVIVADGEDAGTVCVWEHDQDGERISEIGWMVVPELQGRGLASRAVREVLEHARSDGRWGAIHAYPATTNSASNAICKKMGLSHVGERDIVYADRTLRCNDWVWLATRPSLPSGARSGG